MKAMPTIAYIAHLARNEILQTHGAGTIYDPNLLHRKNPKFTHNMPMKKKEKSRR